jgi:predicted nuclease of predicted toxin-antitoxin system
MKFIVDVNMSALWVEAIRDAGHEALHWLDVGKGNADDKEIMSWARNNDAHVLTIDLDFGAILAASGRERPSVIQFRPGRHLPSRLLPLFLETLSRYERALENGALITIDHRHARLRLLPLSENRLM